MLQCLECFPPPLSFFFFFFWLPLVALGLSLALFKMIFLCLEKEATAFTPNRSAVVPAGVLCHGVCRNEQERIRRRYLRDI